MEFVKHITPSPNSGSDKSQTATNLPNQSNQRLSKTTRIVKSIQDFTTTFNNQCQKTDPDSMIEFEINMLTCPTSIFMVLVMILWGAVAESAQEIKKCLGLENVDIEPQDLIETMNILSPILSDGNRIVEMANFVLANKAYEIVPAFRDRVIKCAEFEAINFSNLSSVCAKINSIANARTHGMISEIIKPDGIDPDTTVVLMAIIYMKIIFCKKFDTKLTRRDAVFHGSLGDSKVDMMYQRGDFLFGKTNPNHGLKPFTVLEIPCEGGFYLGFALMDDENYPITMEMFSDPGFQSAWNNLREREVDTYIPKFSHEQCTNVIPPMRSIGVNGIFDNNSALSGMVTQGSYVYKFECHLALKITEEGVEASAVAVACCMEKCMARPSKPERFIFDRCGGYYIRDDNTNVKWFTGVFDPKPST